jgi:signal transduction histidine kinase
VERCILVAEDSPTQAERVRLLLEADGYRVEVVANGREGLGRIQLTPPDLVISDVVMPEMDGYAFCQAVKSAERTRRIPFVLLTEQNTPADCIRGLQVGADNFIGKPFEDTYLLERVRRIFENVELRRKGHLDVEITLSVGAHQITVNADKQQMIELLFTTLDELVGANRRLVEAEKVLREATQEAQRANRAKSEFLSRMSHELRTPLNAILGFGQLLEMWVDRPRERESVKQIVKAGRHLLNLINEVLDLSRIEAGRLALSPEPVRVGDTIGHVVDLVRMLASERQIALCADGATLDGRYVLADRQRLLQVLLNLVANGIKYNREGGRLAVGCHEVAGGRLRITVADTGAGIPLALQKRLFTPFDRLGIEAQGTEGTGLGLALSKRLVEAMGGLIGVESTEGEGSTFWVELPETQAPRERGGPPRPGDTGRAVGAERRGTVLYIEDNASNLHLVEQVLAELTAMRFIPAMQARLGLALAREHRPDLILADLHLPDMSGEDVLREVRGDPKLRETPVVILSADASPGQIQRLLDAGARAYLTKPLDLGPFLELVDTILAARASGRGLAGSEEPELEREPDQLRAAPEPELVDDAGAVGLDGLDADR